MVGRTPLTQEYAGKIGSAGFCTRCIENNKSCKRINQMRITKNKGNLNVCPLKM